MELRQIRQFSRIGGSSRDPGATEHSAYPMWDNNLGYFKYSKIDFNTKTTDGLVSKGDSSANANYIWKLDSNKNPGWRAEKYLVSAERVVGLNDLRLTMSDSTYYTVPLGLLAWSNSDIPGSPVTSVFTRVGDVVATAGDYNASMVTNAFDLTTNVLGDITEGLDSYHFTDQYRAYIQTLQSLGIHNITNIGSGQIITEAERALLHAATDGLEETIRDTTASFIKDGLYINWIHDDPEDTLTADLTLSAITTDIIQEGSTNLYFTEERANSTISITLPSASTVQTRILGTVSGVDYPTGWSLTVGDSPVDLLVTHNLNKKINNVTVFSIDGLGQERMLVPFSNAFGGIISPNSNSVVIEALSDITTPLRVNLTFGPSLGTVIPPEVVGIGSAEIGTSFIVY